MASQQPDNPVDVMYDLPDRIQRNQAKATATIGLFSRMLMNIFRVLTVPAILVFHERIGSRALGLGSFIYGLIGIVITGLYATSREFGATMERSQALSRGETVPSAMSIEQQTMNAVLVGYIVLFVFRSYRAHRQRDDRPLVHSRSMGLPLATVLGMPFVRGSVWRAWGVAEPLMLMFIGLIVAEWAFPALGTLIAGWGVGLAGTVFVLHRQSVAQRMDARDSQIEAGNLGDVSDAEIAPSAPEAAWVVPPIMNR